MERRASSSIGTITSFGLDFPSPRRLIAAEKAAAHSAIGVYGAGPDEVRFAGRCALDEWQAHQPP